MKSFHKMPCRYKDMAAVCLVSCHKFGKDKVQKEVGQNDTESVPTKPSCSLGYGGGGWKPEFKVRNQAYRPKYLGTYSVMQTATWVYQPIHACSPTISQMPYLSTHNNI